MDSQAYMGNLQAMTTLSLKHKFWLVVVARESLTVGSRAVSTWSPGKPFADPKVTTYAVP